MKQSVHRWLSPQASHLSFQGLLGVSGLETSSPLLPITCTPQHVGYNEVWPVGCWVGGTHAAQAQPDPAGRSVDVGGLAKQKQCFKESAARRHFLSKRPRWASVRVARPDLRSEQLGIFRDGPSAGLSFSGHPHLSAHLSPPSWCGGLAPVVCAPALGRVVTSHSGWFAAPT